MTDIISKYRDYFTPDWVATGNAIEDRLRSRFGGTDADFEKEVATLLRTSKQTVRRYLDGENPSLCRSWLCSQRP